MPAPYKNNETMIFGIHIKPPVFPIETNAYNYLKKKRFEEAAWNGKDVFCFSLFINYLRLLKVQALTELDFGFMNNLRTNVLNTFIAGSLSKEYLRITNETVNQFLNETLYGENLELLSQNDLVSFVRERERQDQFNDDAYEDTLGDLRKYSLHTEAAILEVVRELGLSLKEGMVMNPCLAIESALCDGHIVVRNESGTFSRQVPVRYIEQISALHKLALNRLQHDPDESYLRKNYPFFLQPPSQITKHLANNGLSLYAVRHKYFSDEVLRLTDVDLCEDLNQIPVKEASYSYNQVKALCFTVSKQMGHQFCFDDDYAQRHTPFHVRDVVSAQSAIETSPRVFKIADAVSNYLRPIRKSRWKAAHELGCAND